MFARLTLLTALALLFAGCRTIYDPFDAGKKSQKRGDHREAVDAYSEALANTPEWTEAQNRLRKSANEAISQRYETAKRLKDPLAAAETCLEIDRVIARGREANVGLEIPDDYPRFRRDLLDTAIETKRTRARELAARGKWRVAQRLIRQAGEDFHATTQQHRLLREDAVQIQLDRARKALAKNRYCDAQEILRDARKLAAESHVSEDLRALEQRVADFAAKRVVVFPLWAPPEAGELPPGFLDDLNHSLHAALQDTPAFLQVAPQTEITSWLRTNNLSRRSRSVASSANAGEDLKADLVVNAWLERMSSDESSLTGRPIQARTREGEATEYTLLSGPCRIHCQVRFVVIDTATRKAVLDKTLNTVAKGRIERATFAGNIRTLNLNPAERRLFHLGGNRSTEDDLMRKAAQQLVDATSRLAGCDR